MNKIYVSDVAELAQYFWNVKKYITYNLLCQL